MLQKINEPLPPSPRALSPSNRRSLARAPHTREARTLAARACFAALPPTLASTTTAAPRRAKPKQRRAPPPARRPAPPPLPVAPRLLHADRAPPAHLRGGLSRSAWLRAQIHNRLRPHLHNWRRITSDRAVLAIVQRGLRLELNAPLRRRRRSIGFRGSPAEQRHLAAMLQEWIAQGLISPAMDDNTLIHLLFPVPKSNGDLRWVLDLRALNDALVVRKFKMTALPHLRQLVQPGWWATSIDLEAAYHHVLIDPAQQKLLGFRALGRVWKWRSMVFGIATAPKAFTDLIKPVLSQLHEEGIAVMAFLDDFLISAPTPALARTHTQRALELLESLGFSINRKKSELIPTQKLVYLGFQLDLQSFSISVPNSKLENAVSISKKALRRARAQPLPVRTLATLAGVLTAFSATMPAARMRARPLHKLVAFALRHARGSVRARWRSAAARLSRSARQTLRWMASRERLSFANRPTPISCDPARSVVLTTDASDSGWGATLSLPLSLASPTPLALSSTFAALPRPSPTGAASSALLGGLGSCPSRLGLPPETMTTTSATRSNSAPPPAPLLPGASLEAAGIWPANLRFISSINFREAAAVALALELWLPTIVATLGEFEPQIPGFSLVVKSDNSTTCSYINKWGGRLRHLSQVLLHPQLQLLRWHIPVRAFHLAGVLNLRADALSRQQSALRHEWTISDNVVREILRRSQRDSLDFDWFAQPLNAKAQSFATRWAHPQATLVDAFLHPWAHPPDFLQLWVPPLSLLSRTVAKILRDRASGWLVCPRWTATPWFATLISLPIVDSFRISPTEISQFLPGRKFRITGNSIPPPWLAVRIKFPAFPDQN